MPNEITETRRRRAALVASLVLSVSAAGIGSCAGASSRRCGTGRPPTPGQQNTRAQQGGPYCLYVEAEGVGNLSFQVNRAPPAVASTEEAGPALGPAAGGPVTYTLAPAPGNVTFVDVCSMPGARRTLAMVDDQYDQIPTPGTAPIPFPIRVYDQQVNPPFTLSSNGWVSFTPNTSGSLAGQIPHASPPNLTIAPYWNDLYTRATGICYGVVGTAPNRRFVVQWQDLHFCCTDDPSVHLTFEVVVHEPRRGRNNNVIDVVYQSMDGANMRTTSAGLENESGTQGVVISPPWTAPRALRYTPSR